MEMKNHKDDYDENDDVVKKAVCNQFHLSIAWHFQRIDKHHRKILDPWQIVILTSCFFLVFPSASANSELMSFMIWMVAKKVPKEMALLKTLGA